MTGLGASPDQTAAAGLVAATAANLAGWHDRNLRALGLPTDWRDGWWLSPGDAPVIYFRAIAVRPGADPAVLAALGSGGWIAACDPWADQPLERHGFTFEAHRPWMVRPAGPSPVPSLPGDVTMARVEDADGLLAYEQAAAIGFGAAAPPPFTWHAPPLLADPAVALWLGRAGGSAVATANGFRHAGVLGVYSVSTVAAARRRGIATALTAQAVAAAPDVPAVLQPSEMAEPLYRRLGFSRFTTFRTWTRSIP